MNKSTEDTLEPRAAGSGASPREWPPDRWIKALTAAWWLVGLITVCVDPDGSSSNLTVGAALVPLLAILSVPLALGTGVWASRQRRVGKRWGLVAAVGLSPVGVIALVVAVAVAYGLAASN